VARYKNRENRPQNRGYDDGYAEVEVHRVPLTNVNLLSKRVLSLAEVFNHVQGIGSTFLVPLGHSAPSPCARSTWPGARFMSQGQGRRQMIALGPIARGDPPAFPCRAPIWRESPRFPISDMKGGDAP
jgi:hypothetical protein